jgi:phosphoglycerol transferase MdoB-like AlkP superfamily enzyme
MLIAIICVVDKLIYMWYRDEIVIVNVAIVAAIGMHDQRFTATMRMNAWMRMIVVMVAPAVVVVVVVVVVIKCTSCDVVSHNFGFRQKVYRRLIVTM